MSESLADLFDWGEDFDLCNKLAVRISEERGNSPDVTTLSEEERTVFLVWGALGVIGNGGFRYLFEGTVRGDPDFALTRHSFETIGCWDAAEAFTQAFAAFSGGRPPINAAKRLREYQRQVQSFPSSADRAFFAAQELVARCLANWVRSRKRSFMHLE